jgi:hypothetical protein
VTEPSSAPTWQVAALVERVGTRDILVGSEATVDQLPTTGKRIEIQPFAADAFGFVETLLAAPVVPRRLTWLPTEGWRSGVIVAEMEPLEAAPTGFRWVDSTSVLDTLIPEPARSVIRRHTERRDGAISPQEPSWARPGWVARASAWMEAQLRRAGIAIAEPPRLVYQGPLGSVLRAASDGRATFLKCAPPAFPHEATVTHALWRRTPEAVPAVIAVEPNENWLLMHDYEGRLVDAGPERAWPDALVAFGALQRSWIPWTRDIAAAGGQIRPLDQLASAIPQMLDLAGFGHRLDDITREAWLAATPGLVEACGELIDIGVPDTLIHGDLHPGNVVVTPTGHITVDWSDAAVGNPFVDLATFVVRTKDRDLRRRLAAAYVQSWDGVTRDALPDNVADLAMVVGSVYQVATYLALLPAMDPPDRALFEGADLSWAKRALEALEHGLDTGLTS